MKRIEKKYKDISIIALLLICLVVLFGVIRNNTTKQEIFNIDDTKEDGVLNFSGVGVFFDIYTGDFKASDVAKKLEEVTTIYLPELINTVNDYNEMQLIKYFYQNQESIKKVYGITDYEIFIDFVNKINETGVDLNNWYRLDVDEETFIDNSDKKGYSYVQYSVSMKNDDMIYFSLYVSKSSKKSIPYIIDVIKK